MVIFLAVVVLVIRKPLAKVYRNHISTKRNQKKKQRDQMAQDLRMMIQIAYEKGGITQEEMRIFERRGQEIGLSGKEFQELFKSDDF